MKINEIKNNSTDLHIRVTIPFQEISYEINQELDKLAKNAKVDGFRVGKVPIILLQKKYGNSLHEEAVRNKIIKAISDIKKDRSLKVFIEPKIEDIKNEENKDLEFTIKYQLLPNINMLDLKKVSIDKPVLNLEDKDVDAELELLVNSSKKYDRICESEAKNGDQVTIDAIGYVEGKAFDGGKLSSHQLVLGSNTFIPGFEEQLIGTKSGDEISVKVSFPNSYHEETLAGKPSEFKVKVLKVHNETPLVLDNDFAKKFGFENLQELKDHVRKTICDNYEDSVTSMMTVKLFNKLEDVLEFDIPPSLIEREIRVLKKEVLEKNIEKLKTKTEEDKELYFIKLATRRVRLGLMISEYITLHKLEVNNADIQKAVMSQAKKSPGKESDVINFYSKNSHALNSLKDSILESKAIRRIFENEVKLVEKSYNKTGIDLLLKTEMLQQKNR